MIDRVNIFSLIQAQTRRLSCVRSVATAHIFRPPHNATYNNTGRKLFKTAVLNGGVIHCHNPHMNLTQHLNTEESSGVKCNHRILFVVYLLIKCCVIRLLKHRVNNPTTPMHGVHPFMRTTVYQLVTGVNWCNM